MSKRNKNHTISVGSRHFYAKTPPLAVPKWEAVLQRLGTKIPLLYVVLLPYSSYKQSVRNNDDILGTSSLDVLWSPGPLVVEI